MKLRHITRIFVALTTILWSVGAVNFIPLPARAASTVSASTASLINGNFPGAPVPASSPALALVKLSVTASQADQTLTSVQVDFSGTGFDTTDLATLAADDTSGVALYDDAGVGNIGMLGSGDNLIAPATPPSWSSNSVTLTPATPPALSSGTAVIFFVAVKTSASISNDDRLALAIPVNGVVTSDGNGPGAAFNANEVRADTAPAQIMAVGGYVGSATVSVYFNKPVQKVGGGNLAVDDFTYVDGGGSTQTISGITHTAGQGFVQLTMSSALDAGDLSVPATLAAGLNKIADMGGNVVGTSAVNLTSPLELTTPAVPSTTVGAVFDSDTPLVTLAAAGGTAPYTFATNDANDATWLTSLGLAVASNGKITGTVANVPGSHTVNFRVTDSTGGTPLVSMRVYTFNIAPSGGGGIPGINNVTPPGGAQGASSLSVAITGTNTHFTGSSTVEFLFPPGVSGTNGITLGAVSAASATSITVPVTVAADASLGARDVKVTTGSEVAIMPNGFNVFAAAGSGLNLLLPTDAATGIPLPPAFSFSASNTAGVQSYRLTVKSNSSFTGSALWDYIFPAPGGPGDASNHCGDGGCNVPYGAGLYRVLTQPTPLSPNTTYYWQVRTYNTTPFTFDVNASAALENTVVRSFATTASITDTMPPSIMHRPLFQAVAASTLTLFARVMDNIATRDTTPALTTFLRYCNTGSSCTPDTDVTGTFVGSGYYQYVIASGNVPAATGTIRYFLQATDGTNTNSFKQPDNVTPFAVTTVTAPGSPATIAGTVKDSTDTCAAGVQTATVFAEGTGFNATSDGSCAYSLGGLFAGTYDVVAVKDTYADRLIGGVPAGSTGVNFRLTSGFSGGFGGDSTKPRVKFSGPMDGMSGIPGSDSNFKIFLAFDKAMSQTSVTTTGNMTVNEVNPATGELSNITSSKGSWTYYPTNPSLPNVPPEDNLAVWSFSSSNTFGDNKNIAVVVTTNVTDTAGNPIQGNQSDGSYVFSFTTNSTANFSGFNSTTGQFSGGGTFGSGQYMPPHVTGVMPAPGSFNVPLNSKTVINFSDPMADDTGDYILKNNLKLYTVSGASETDVSSSALNTVTLDSTKLNATINLAAGYNSGTYAASTKYRVKVLGGAKAANGMTLMLPTEASAVAFMAEFQTGTTSDTAAPTVVGSYPNNGDTNVPTSLAAINVGFNKDMSAGTITSATVYLSIGSSTVNGTTEYNPLDRQAFFVPQTALTPNTTYTINVTTGVQALNGQALASAVTRTFTTGAADTTAPAVVFVNADDYSLAVTFSRPMIAAKATDSLNFASSVLKPANVSLKYGTAGFEAGAGTAITLPATASFSYDAMSSTLLINGYHEAGLTAATLLNKEMLVTVTNVKDTAGNAIGVGNTGRANIQDSVITKGALGPMAMKADAFSSMGGFTPDNFDANTFGFAPPVEVRPFNAMAGQSTIYGARLPISQQIPSGGTVVLTFPTGFDVAGARQDLNSPMRTDLNGPGTGVVTFKCATAGAPTGASCAGTANTDDTGAAQGGLAGDGIVVNSTIRTVTVYLNGATRSEGADAHDFLTIDIAGITNSTVPKDFNTSGYTVDVKTKSDATMLESMTSQPFFIQSAGSNSLTGTITATGAGSGTMQVYLASPMTGPMETTSTTFSGGSASYTFTSLANGDYALFTDQTITLGATEYTGKSMPEKVVVSGNTAYNFSIANSTSTGTTVTVNIDGPANEPLDIFAGSPTGFKAKQVTLDTSAGAQAFTIKLTDGNWYVGVGPQMPKGFMSGPPPTPSYLPPKPKDVQVTDPNCTVDGVTGCSLTFTLTATTKSIRGLVKDGAAKVIANAEVYAYSPNDGFGTHAQADSSGAFTLGVADGSYIVGAFIPGMPPSKEVPVVVTSHATTYLVIDGATTAITPAAAATSFVLKVAKPDYTISGKVTDGTNVVQGASVYAYRNDGPGHANANTDSSGNYTLYVTNGTWKVGTFLPQYGNLAEITVTVNSASVTNQNFSPSLTGTFYTVSGTVTSGGVPVQGAFVRLNGNSTFNETITASDGVYSFKVPEGNGYIVRAFVPSVGETAPLAAFNVSGADVTGKDITVGAPRTITVTFSAVVSQALVEMFSATGIGNRVKLTNVASGVLSLPDGSYTARVNVPGTDIRPTDIAATDDNTTYSSTTGIVTVNSNEGLTVTLPTLRTITGTVNDGTDPLADAWVELVNPTNGIHFGNKTAADGSFSLQAADGSYLISAMKPGYFRQPSQLTVNAATGAQTLTLTVASTTIAGQVLIGSSGASNAFVRAEKQGGGFAGTQADSTGNYTLYVTAGVWHVYAVAEGYAEVGYASNPIDVSGGSVTGKNITLSTTVSLNPPKSKPITPASGGTMEDTTSGVKLTIPANALGSSNSAGNIQTKETNNVRETSSARPLGGKAAQITATDSSGTPITNLSSSVTVEMTYTKAELAAVASASDDAIDTMAEVDSLSMAYWDETTASWVTKPTTMTYKDASGNVITNLTIVDTAPEFDANVATVTIAAVTDHFSLYAPVVSTNPSAPSTPTGLVAVATSNSQINLSWTQVSGATSYDIYRSTSLGGTYTRVGSEPTVSSGSTTSYSNTGLADGTAYYYKITALNTSGESAAADAVTATTQSGGGGGGSSADTTPPTGASVVINNNAATTTSTQVNLTLAAGGADYMMIANSTDFAGGVWETYATSKSWQLTAGDGVKTVYVKFRDSALNATSAVTDTITLTASATPTPATTSETASPVPTEAERQAEIAVINTEAQQLFANSAAEVAQAAGSSRQLPLEQTYSSSLVTRILPATTSNEVRNRVTAFVSYGTVGTLTLGAGERAGVVNSFRAAFGRTPQSESDWQDVLKIASGRFPGTLNAAREQAVAATFKRIYLRAADRANTYDNAAITVMAYGLRAKARRLDSERAAIATFRAVFRRLPTSAADWDAVRGVAYSGATR